MIVALKNWALGLLRGQVDGRFTGLAVWGRRSVVARGYDEWAGCGDVNLGEVYPADDDANRRADQMLRDELGPQYGALMRQGYLDVDSTLFRNTAYRLRPSLARLRDTRGGIWWSPRRSLAGGRGSSPRCCSYSVRCRLRLGPRRPSRSRPCRGATSSCCATASTCRPSWPSTPLAWASA